jgi:hypothetical protein
MLDIPPIPLLIMTMLLMKNVVAKRSATERTHVGSSPPAPDQRCMGNANKQIIVKKYPDVIQKYLNISAVPT